eukprot:272035_1
MNHYHYSVLITFILSIYTFITTSSPILDISDYTFYYTTYHYILPPLTTNTTSFYNNELSLNITISFNTNISITVTNNEPLNLLSNNQWNEISFISRINKINPPPSNSISSSPRRLVKQTEYSEEKQYEGVPHGKNWLHANMYCKSTRRGHIATIMDEDDNNEVASECSKLGTRWHCWLGLKRPFKTWINNEPVSFTNWLPGEPNNWGGNENCVEIYGTDEQEGFQEMWNDLKCDMMRGIVCERPAHPKPEINETKRKLMCDCEDINYNRDEYLRRRLAKKKQKCGCKKLSKKEIRKRRKQKLRWARIRAYARWKRRQRDRKRRAKVKMKRRNRRRRRRWRQHLRRLRRKRRSEMKREYKREMKLEKRRDEGYSLLNKLIASALGNKHSKGARFGA